MRDHLREKVVAAFPIHPRGHEVDFWVSLLALRDYDRTFGKRLDAGPGWLIANRNSGNVAIARNHICKVFLEQTTADWLWFIDTDQTFDPDILERMVASADPVERPILSALIMAERDKQYPISPACIGFDDATPPNPCTYDGIPAVQHWPVGATGSGCVLIHRSVLAALWAQYKDHPFPFFEYARWERTMPDGSIVPGVLGEDYTFALRAAHLGFSCWVDTTIEAGHVKARTLTSADFYAQSPELARQRFAATPAATVAIIPFKDKWKMTRATAEGAQADLVLLMNNGSTQDATQAAVKWCDGRAAEVVDCKGLGIHEMWNAGTEIALERFPKVNLAFLNNDLELGPDCLPVLAEALRSGPENLVSVCPNYDERWYADEYGHARKVDDVEPLQGIAANKYDGTGGLAGFCFMVKGEWFQTGWRFPEDAMWWYGDNLLTMSIDVAGGWYGMVHAATVKHLDGGGQTLGGNSYAGTPQERADWAAFVKHAEALGYKLAAA